MNEEQRSDRRSHEDDSDGYHVGVRALDCRWCLGVAVEPAVTGGVVETDDTAEAPRVVAVPLMDVGGYCGMSDSAQDVSAGAGGEEVRGG